LGLGKKRGSVSILFLGSLIMSNENWHLEKKFTISFIMAFIGAVCSGVWHVAEFKYQITENTHSIVRVEEKVKSNEAYSSALTKDIQKILIEIASLQATVTGKNEYIMSSLDDLKQSQLRMTTAINKLSNK